MRWSYRSWRGVQYSDDPSDLLVMVVYDNHDDSDGDFDEVQDRPPDVEAEVEAMTVGESRQYGPVVITRTE